MRPDDSQSVRPPDRMFRTSHIAPTYRLETTPLLLVLLVHPGCPMLTGLILSLALSVGGSSPS